MFLIPSLRLYPDAYRWLELTSERVFNRCRKMRSHFFVAFHSHASFFLQSRCRVSWCREILFFYNMVLWWNGRNRKTREHGSRCIIIRNNTSWTACNKIYCSRWMIPYVCWLLMQLLSMTIRVAVSVHTWWDRTLHCSISKHHHERYSCMQRIMKILFDVSY